MGLNRGLAVFAWSVRCSEDLLAVGNVNCERVLMRFVMSQTFLNWDKSASVSSNLLFLVWLSVDGCEEPHSGEAVVEGAASPELEVGSSTSWISVIRLYRIPQL